MEAVGSPLTNKYAEGLPGKRYYGGCWAVDEVENLARDRAKALFGAAFANVQPPLRGPGQLRRPRGAGPLPVTPSWAWRSTTGATSRTARRPTSPASSTTWSPMVVDEKTERTSTWTPWRRSPARRGPRSSSPAPRPIRASSTLRALRRSRTRSVPRLMVDMAHIAGLVATGRHPSPVPCADVVTTTTHKTLRGPRGRPSFSATTPISPRGRLRGVPRQPGWPARACDRRQGRGLWRGARARLCRLHRCRSRQRKGPRARHGEPRPAAWSPAARTTTCCSLTSRRRGTSPAGTPSAALDAVGITVNKNTIPGEKRSPFVTSGIRVGSAAVTTRGFSERECERVGELIGDVVTRPGSGEDGRARLLRGS